MSATIAAPTTLNGYSWFGLVVYFTVSKSPIFVRLLSSSEPPVDPSLAVGLIIRGVHIPIPFFLSRPARALLQFLRILDPRSERSPTVYDVATPRTASKSRASVSAVTEVGLERTPSNASSLRPTPSHLSSTRPSLRSRSESKIGFAAQEEDTTPIASEDDAEVEVSWTGPPPEKRVRFPLDLRTAPVIGVLLLLATTTIDESVLRLGIVGEDGVQPYDVLVLFISLVSRASLLSLRALTDTSSGLHLDCTRRYRWTTSTSILDCSESSPSAEERISLDGAYGEWSSSVPDAVHLLVYIGCTGR
jgi:hypothetical protein